MQDLELTLMLNLTLGNELRLRPPLSVSPLPPMIDQDELNELYREDVGCFIAGCKYLVIAVVLVIIAYVVW